MIKDRTNFEDWLQTKKNSSDIGTVLKKISVVCKIISAKIRRAAIKDLTGSTTITNSHGETVKTLDIISNGLFINGLSKLETVHSLISEENLHEIEVHRDGKYIVSFDPLDGSSNIDANVNIGSIFGIFPRKYERGKDQLASGYVLYGTSTILVVAYDNEVNGFTLDEGIGEYILTYPDMRVGDKKIYSVNESNKNRWDEPTKELVDHLKDDGFSARYIGSMVCDVHRTILYGGIFMYPANKLTNNSDLLKKGKLRYMYEIAPISLIIEYAGGKALCARDVEALDLIPESIHQRCPIYLGTEEQIEQYREYFNETSGLSSNL